MTELQNIAAGVPDWEVLSIEGVDDIAQQAARIVSLKYKDRAVGSLAEYDDLLQEARIILATRLSVRVKFAILEGSASLILNELVKDLLNVARRTA